MNFFFTVNGPFPLIHQIYTQVSRYAGKLQIAAKYLISTTSKHDRPANNHRIACCPFSTYLPGCSQPKIVPKRAVSFITFRTRKQLLGDGKKWIHNFCFPIRPGGCHDDAISTERALAGKEMCRDLPRNEDTFHHLVLGCPGYSNPSIIRHTTKRRGCQAALETCKSIVFTRRGNNDDNEGFVVLVIRRFFFCHTRVRLVDSMHTSGYRERACCWRYCQGNKNYNLDWKKLLAAGPCVGWETTSMQKSGKHGSDN